jgi:SAM-dependent methyltransferase
MEEKLQIQTQAAGLTNCPVCLSDDLQPVLELAGMPVLYNVLWKTKEEALSVPRGDIRLSFCESCGHVFNRAYEASLVDYDVPYENSLHYSSLFQNYANWLVRYLVNQHDLHGKTIIEIGSGKGDFLRMLCEYGGNVGTGFDPSYQQNSAEGHHSMSFIRDEYSQRYASYQADLICSRHTLEHLSHPASFIQELRRTIGERKRTVVFVEVPNLSYILHDTAIWDIIYEHYSYFSAFSLANLFNSNGFNVLNVAEAFHSQFLYIEAFPRDLNKTAPNNPLALPFDMLRNQVAGFTERSREKIDSWREKIDQLSASGKRTVIWGAGSKGISFLNLLEVKEDEIEYAVDINPRKRNMRVTGTGQEIVPPEFLHDYQPDSIIIMNPIYLEEIGKTVAELGLQPEFLIP